MAVSAEKLPFCQPPVAVACLTASLSGGDGYMRVFLRQDMALVSRARLARLIASLGGEDSGVRVFLQQNLMFTIQGFTGFENHHEG